MSATVDAITGGGAGEATSASGFKPANAEFASISGDAIFAMTFDPEADPEALPDLAREFCDKREFCNILGWSDPKFTAKGFPLTERESDHLKFQYTVNRTSGLAQTIWDCRVWQRADKVECLMID